MSKYWLITLFIVCACSLSGATNISKKDIILGGKGFYEMIYKVDDPEGNYVQSQYKDAEKNSYIISIEADNKFINEAQAGHVINLLNQHIELEMASICHPLKPYRKSGPDLLGKDRLNPVNNPGNMGQMAAPVDGYTKYRGAGMGGLAYLIGSDTVKYRYICQ